MTGPAPNQAAALAAMMQSSGATLDRVPPAQARIVATDGFVNAPPRLADALRVLVVGGVVAQLDRDGTATIRSAVGEIAVRLSAQAQTALQAGQTLQVLVEPSRPGAAPNVSLILDGSPAEAAARAGLPTGAAPTLGPGGQPPGIQPGQAPLLPLASGLATTLQVLAQPNVLAQPPQAPLPGATPFLPAGTLVPSQVPPNLAAQAAARATPGLGQTPAAGAMLVPGNAGGVAIPSVALLSLAGFQAAPPAAARPRETGAPERAQGVTPVAPSGPADPVESATAAPQGTGLSSLLLAQSQERGAEALAARGRAFAALRPGGEAPLLPVQVVGLGRGDAAPEGLPPGALPARVLTEDAAGRLLVETPRGLALLAAAMPRDGLPDDATVWLLAGGRGAEVPAGGAAARPDLAALEAARAQLQRDAPGLAAQLDRLLPQTGPHLAAQLAALLVVKLDRDARRIGELTGGRAGFEALEAGYGVANDAAGVAWKTVTLPLLLADQRMVPLTFAWRDDRAVEAIEPGLPEGARIIRFAVESNPEPVGEVSLQGRLLRLPDGAAGQLDLTLTIQNGALGAYDRAALTEAARRGMEEARLKGSFAVREVGAPGLGLQPVYSAPAAGEAVA